MNDKFLKLHLTQAKIALNKSSNNDYSDSAKEKYQSCLINLFKEISNHIESGITCSDIETIEIKKEIDFIFKSLEFLDNSTLNLIPYELVECLKIAMSDWLQQGDKYIITTSLINNVLGFSFDSSVFQNITLFQSILKKYGIDFEEKLVLINVPKVFARDYLISIVLYHELGHFIDHRYKISNSIAMEIFNQYHTSSGYNSSEKQILVDYFPFLGHLSPNTLSILTLHVAEYFCDLFAAQYVGTTIYNFLNYHTIGYKNQFTTTHPSSLNRTKIVDNFLDQKDDFLLEIIRNGISSTTSGKSLKIRYKDLSKDNFFNFIPVEITNEEELHSIYKLGWDIWKNDLSNFSKKMNISFELKSEQIYMILNNLIEKSIGNYIISKKWSQII